MPVFDLDCQIFSNMEAILQFFQENNVIEAVRECQVCHSNASIKLQKQNGELKLIYRCNNTNCRRRIPLTSSKIKLPKLLKLIFMLMAETDYQQMYLFYGVSKGCVSRIKRNLNICFERYLNSRPLILGGEGIDVEIDETVLSRRGIVRNPTSFESNRNDTIWILGAIENSPSKNFFISRIPDRTITSITNALQGIIRNDVNLLTDGHPSYPSVARNLNCVHRNVNHSVGFVAPDGTHTNNIEGFWSHLKSSMRKENGVKRVYIDRWIIQYTFRRRFLVGCSREVFCRIFTEILQLYFN